MDREEVLNEFRAAGALMSGHFILTSGLHSPVYLQCARVMMDASRGARLCAALADKVRARFGDEIDMVASPALGGIVVGYEIGRQLGRPAIFFERVDGVFTLRRGFEIPKGARCLMAEDVVTTGLSSRECIAAIEAAGGKVLAGCCLIDRSGGDADIGVDLISLAELAVPTYRADSLPPELSAIRAVKPGSRAL
ncbi:MAG: orotate phosphoribosyltransferase [Hyphomicrobiales bacterium]|nr:orotate phosphoribosyltransferase [Hyphomicrobiales bacterium]